MRKMKDKATGMRVNSLLYVLDVHHVIIVKSELPSEKLF